MSVLEDRGARCPLWAKWPVEIAVLCAAWHILVTSRDAASRAAKQRLLTFSNWTGKTSADLDRRGEPTCESSAVKHRETRRARRIDRAACARTLACISGITDRNADGLSVDNGTPCIPGALGTHVGFGAEAHTLSIRKNGITDACIPSITVVTALRRRTLTQTQVTLTLWLFWDGDAHGKSFPRCIGENALLPRRAILATDAAFTRAGSPITCAKPSRFGRRSPAAHACTDRGRRRRRT